MNNIIKKLFVFTLLAWPFGLLLSYQTNYFPFPVYLLDILVILLSTFVIASLEHEPKQSIPWLMAITVVTISFLFNLSRITLISLAYTTRLFAYPSIYFLTLRYKNLVKKYFPISLGIFVFLGLAQYLLFPDMRYLKLLGFDDHYFRLIGTLYDPNFSGAILSAITLYFFIKSKYLWGSLSLVSLALTFSRASYLSFFVGLILYTYLSKKFKLLTLLIAISILVILVPKPFGEGVNLLRTFSIYSRIGNWQENLVLFFQNPLFGWGYGTIKVVDSSPIFVLVSTGLLGFASFVALIFQLSKKLTATGQALLVTLVFHSFFNNSLFFIWIYFFFWVVVALETKGYKRPED